MKPFMLGLYSAFAIGAQPFLRRKIQRRGIAEPGYLDEIEERFGTYEEPAQPGAMWIHAVSLGETRAAAILIDELRRRKPGIRFLLTHGTATGRGEGERLLQVGDAQAWVPWDTPKAVRRFLDHFQPCVGVLMETEVWPNLVAGARAHGLPLVLANARLSDKSLAQTRRLASLARPAYASLSAVWAQTEADAERLALAGATVKGVFGNLKFDAAPDPSQLEQGRAWRAANERPVVVFASSREGEEADFLRILRGDPQLARVQWLIVPRHPQRFDQVVAMIEGHGYSVSRRSEWSQRPESVDIWIGDSLGEMALYYGLSDVALLGGSFAPLGGQNLIEAAACSCPVVMGPHTFNFAEASELALQAGAATRVSSMQEGVRTAVALAEDTARLAKASQDCLAFASAHQGAARKTAEAVLHVMGESSQR
ncbi:MAG TPA: 3-deoxy-D-manno-octulosonic acid transferase [Ramlibacter sp.]|nr:3-deoxy-D-manno-octulosonic acid transferase [Ramlibacter sp.]